MSFGGLKKGTVYYRFLRLNKKKRATFVGLLLLLCLLFVSGLSVVLSSNENITAKQSVADTYVVGKDKTVKVFTSIANISAGTPLTQVKFRASELKASSDAAKQAVKKGVVTSAKHIIGKFAKFEIKSGYPILHNQITEEVNDIRIVPNKGMQAAVIRISDAAGMEGIINQGSQVDVILTFSDKGEYKSKRVAENVKVLLLSTDQIGENSRRRRANSATRVTLEVDPDTSLQFKTYQKMGELSLVLRSPEDNNVSIVTDFSEQQIRTDQAAVDTAKDECEKGSMLIDGKRFCL